jgi:DNA replication protein DnaC
MKLQDLIAKFAPNTQKETTHQKDFITINGEEVEVKLRCENCKEPTLIERSGYEYFYECKCEKERQIQAKINRLKKYSLMGKRYENVTFENSETGTNSEFETAFNRCRKYCEVWEDVLKNGQGIYLFGDKGVGKTYLTACMANDLIKKFVLVLFTSLFEISKAVKSTFNKRSQESEQELIDKFSQTEFLVFDDLGTEIFTKNQEDTWQQSLLFDLINHRYNAKKPTIFSSNHSINDLVTVRGLMDKTADRICQMSSGAVMKITGKSRRNEKAENLMF